MEIRTCTCIFQIQYVAACLNYLCVSQECCYRIDGSDLSGPLITVQSGQAGTLTLVDDDLDVTDAMAFQFCCDSTTNGSLNIYCDRYFLQRPVNDCDGFESPVNGEMTSSR